ncbi:DUF6020 family protein [Liquorilactobacillus oeni]|uniref:Glycosyltransferase RgtA/B/C/D-like domain-containing protein n=1 Tax=Liquorilactobacillus oeni DSM 19972 TaxID=1423777 RepID=A0A0R1MD58_9LACO|nr:DUF6020 family protein [Liquorilactobacillus oeni]KRL06016.1 hypothetical protein FD46_GL000348 [Liquorilactobacillus oeni DSM 19972]
MIKKVKPVLWIIAMFSFIVNFPGVYIKENHAIAGRIVINQSLSLLAILWIAILIYFIDYKKKVKIRRTAWIFGTILSFLYTFTYAFSSIEVTAYIKGSKYIAGDPVNFIMTLFVIIGFAVTFSATIAIITHLFEEKIGSGHYENNTCLIALLLMLVWLLIIIPFLPGTVTWDAFRQFDEYQNLHLSFLNFTYVPTNHHPWFVTLFFGTVFDIGSKLGGPNLGIFLIVVIQAVISAFIYAQAIIFVSKRIGKIAGKFTFLFFSLPIFGAYVQTVDKSSLFYAFCVWFCLNYLQVFDAISHRKKLQTLDYLLLFVSSTLMMFFRNDGGYVVIISLLLLTIYSMLLKKKWTKVAFVFLTSLLLFLGWNKVVLNALHVIPGSPGEALTIPMRQTAYEYLMYPEHFSTDDKKVLNKILPLNEIKSRYNVNQADKLKELYPVNTFLSNEDAIKKVNNNELKLEATPKIKKETAAFLKLWLKMGISHPLDYVKVYLQANSRFLNPFFNAINNNDSLFLSFDYMNNVRILKPHWYKNYNYVFPKWFLNLSRDIISAIITMPVVALIANVGMPFWTMIILFGIVISKLKIQYLIALLPLILLTLVPTMSPVNGYSRYGIMGLAILPLFVAYVWREVYENKVK